MVIVYGGSFNPPTRAHIEIMNYLLKKFQPDQLIVVPVGDRYPKAHLAPFHHRVEMLKIATRGMEKVLISTFEDRPVFEGTITLLETIQREYDATVYFVLGADQLVTLDKWIRVEELIARFRFIVLPRDGIDVKEYIAHHPMLSRYQDHFIIADDFPPSALSATLYRWKQDDSVVLPEINEYIYRHQLYQRGVDYDESSVCPCSGNITKTTSR
ncbi:MAG TPA: nicotinate (nicotinamide) nucleotide adenylyltransferase [Haloplasmataceae bacterium]